MRRKENGVKPLHSKLIGLVLVCCLVLAGPHPHAAPMEPKNDLPVEILNPLIVQDFGFEKSFLSFSEERLGMMGRGARSFARRPVLSVLGMILQPEEWRRVPLFKIEHPVLIQLFARHKLISADEFMNENNLEKLRRLVQRDPGVEPAINDLDRAVHALLDLRSQLAIVPRAGGEWQSPYAFDNSGGTSGTVQTDIVAAYAELGKAFRDDSPQAFADAAHRLVALNRTAAERAGTNLRRLNVDLLNTRLHPFLWSAIFYLFATLAYVGALSFGKPRLATGGLLLLLLGLLAQTTGLTFRTLLVGRAPVANMYESLVFAVAGMVVIAMVLDRVYKNPLIGLAGALLGFVFIVIAIKMPLHQSRLNPLRPALQSSWLTYHVVTVMLSYSAFALSFFISLIYLVKDALGGDQAKVRLLKAIPSLESLDFYNYRIIAVGFPLLTLGIFTGAVWAATAWGRPWAFDPKETWSAITWLVYGIFLHTRLLAGWKGRRSAVLGLIGFGAVLFTYLGVNYLLPGLHSYV